MRLFTARNGRRLS